MQTDVPLEKAMENQRLSEARSRLKSALIAFRAEERRAEYERAMAEIADGEKRDALRRAFDELSTEEMAKRMADPQTGASRIIGAEVEPPSKYNPSTQHLSPTGTK